jgi:hypothetical protein
MLGLHWPEPRFPRPSRCTYPQVSPSSRREIEAIAGANHVRPGSAEVVGRPDFDMICSLHKAQTTSFTPPLTACDVSSPRGIPLKEAKCGRWHLPACSGLGLEDVLSKLSCSHPTTHVIIQ